MLQHNSSAVSREGPCEPSKGFEIWIEKGSQREPEETRENQRERVRGNQREPKREPEKAFQNPTDPKNLQCNVHAYVHSQHPPSMKAMLSKTEKIHQVDIAQNKVRADKEWPEKAKLVL